MSDFTDELEEEGAEWALADVRRSFHTHFQNPTGYYESHVHISNIAGSRNVWDGGMAGPVYGPWLEGVGSRNNTTRFKGYHAFRNAAAELQRRYEAMGERLFDSRYLHRF